MLNFEHGCVASTHRAGKSGVVRSTPARSARAASRGEVGICAENSSSQATHFSHPRGRSFLRTSKSLDFHHVGTEWRRMCGTFHSTVSQRDTATSIFSTGQAVLPGRGHVTGSGLTWSGRRVTFAENPAPRGPQNPSARPYLRI